MEVMQKSGRNNQEIVVDSTIRSLESGSNLNVETFKDVVNRHKKKSVSKLRSFYANHYQTKELKEKV